MLSTSKNATQAIAHQAMCELCLLYMYQYCYTFSKTSFRFTSWNSNDPSIHTMTQATLSLTVDNRQPPWSPCIPSTYHKHFGPRDTMVTSAGFVENSGKVQRTCSTMYQTSSDLRIGGLGTPDVVPWCWKSSTKADADKCWKPFFYAHSSMLKTCSAKFKGIQSVYPLVI